MDVRCRTPVSVTVNTTWQQHLVLIVLFVLVLMPFFTITGTAGNTVNYTGAASGTATIGAGGTVNVTVTAVTKYNFKSTSVSNGTCSRPLTATATVTVNALPAAATLSSNSPICSGADAIFYTNWNGRKYCKLYRCSIWNSNYWCRVEQ
jgi:uncharacterized membrane protein